MPLTRDDIDRIFAAVRANSRRLRSCPQHRFPSVESITAIVRRPGQKVTCDQCGGELHITDVGLYIAGYKAAGGNPDDIWPGYDTRRTP